MTSTNKIKEAAGRYNEVILPFALCAVIMSAALNIYTDNVFDIYTAVAMVWTAALFALLSTLKKIRFGGLAYTAILIGMSFVPGFFISGRQDIFAFVQWFFSGAQAVDTRPSFALVFILMLGFFFTSTVYYFTRVIYRSAAIALISLIPFAIAIKAAVVLSTYYIMVVAAINLFLFIFYSRQNMLKNSKKAGSSALILIIYTDFAVASVILAMLIPKPNETPYYEKFEAFTNVFQFGGSGETVYEGAYNQYSGNSDDLLKGESKLLYYLSTDNSTYMKTQVFDVYNSDERRWESTVSMDGSRRWEATAEFMSYEKLAEDVSKAAESDPSFYEKYPFAKALDGISEEESYSVIYPRDFSAVYVLAPLRITKANVGNTGARYSARSDKGEVFTNLRRLPPSMSYNIRYYSERNIYEYLLENGLCNITADEYGNFLEDAAIYNNDAYSAADAFLSELVKAEEYRKATVTAVSPEIQSLSDRLTEGLEYDYQKAAALEQYFHYNGYTYDINYEAPEGANTPEFFLFESKTGTCSNFATAFTLLARAAGLNVRYVEGFVPNAGIDPQPGVYYIYSDNAHAYPEVFIPGAGWTRFEPTVADYSGAGGTGEEETDNTEGYLTIAFTAIIAILVIGLFLLMIFLAPKVAESVFRVKVSVSDNEKAVRMVYNRHLKALGKRYEIDPLPLTAEEASEVTERNTGISLAPIAEPFAAACYGGKPVSDDEKAGAFECYKSQAKEMRKKNKRKEG
ncbi:MAG: hypothetical protein J1E40_08255 [Oscillospiraceae bacterium]|nr:hypothetical protein [Oscillospiraceae bacterium]